MTQRDGVEPLELIPALDGDAEIDIACCTTWPPPEDIDQHQIPCGGACHEAARTGGCDGMVDQGNTRHVSGSTGLASCMELGLDDSVIEYPCNLNVSAVLRGEQVRVDQRCRYHIRVVWLRGQVPEDV